MGYKVPVTLISVEPNVVLIQKENKLVVGLGKRKKIKKTDAAYVKAAGFTPRHIKEIKNPKNPEDQDQKEQFKTGQKITVSIFEPGDEVKVTGTTKGRGFAGGVKRHGFAGGPKTHGQSDRHRAPGSIGAGTTPGRVYKGKRMAGHMGDAKLTVTGLEIIEVDAQNNTLLVKGAIPGAKKGFVIVEKTGKVKGYMPPPPPNEEKQAAQDGQLRSSDEREEKETKLEAEAEDQGQQASQPEESSAEEKVKKDQETAIEPGENKEEVNADK